MTSIKPKIGTCTICNKTDKPLMKKMCCDGYLSCYEVERRKRWAEKAKSKPVAVKAIAKRSPKRAKEEREYNKQAKAYKLANPDCAARLKGCTGVTTDVHHMKGKIGDLLLDQYYWLPVCRSCHDWIEKNPTKSKILGLSVSRLDKEQAA